MGDSSSDSDLPIIRPPRKRAVKLQVSSSEEDQAKEESKKEDNQKEKEVIDKM